MIRIVFLSLLFANAAISARAQDRAAADFFESRVRPVLVERCLECHGENQQEAGLRLDSADGFSKGSDSGSVYNAEFPENSLLLRAIRYKDDVRMPPEGRLPDSEIAAIEQWLKTGAVWPGKNASSPAHVTTSNYESSKSHWAFQPIKRDQNPGSAFVDRWIDAGLHQAGLQRSSQADRRTLIRRATFDLHGLPPTFQEVEAFEKDTAPDAWSRVIERLLASPRYGERWARHWLDVARYADTKGYVRLKDNPLYPASWTYRDYVIQSFNDDLPYNQFVLEQLAADQLLANQQGNINASADIDSTSVSAKNNQSLAAMGFLTLGQRFINSPNDIIDDRIDVVTRGLLGLTVTCARCHDHKFDPVPTADYYSLHGVFASSYEPDVPPMILSANGTEPSQSYREELERRTRQFNDFLLTKKESLEASFRKRTGEYLLAGQFEKVQANFLPVMFLIDASKDLNPMVVQRWARILESSRRRHDPVLMPWNRLSELAAKHSDASFSQRATELLADMRQSTNDKRINSLILNALRASPLNDLTDVSTRYGQVFSDVDAEWIQRTKAGAPAISDAAFPDLEREEIRQLLYGPAAPSVVALSGIQDFLFVDATTQNQFHEQQRLIEDWIASPGAAPHAHVLLDVETPTEPHVFLRGNASNPGQKVPRQFLKILSAPDRRPFQRGSGRLELAQEIVNPNNPLTARVLVNRIWMHHFGNGIVRTPSDFGLRGEVPTHPELLDVLAGQFIDNGWSLKFLHRTIMLSQTYQQQSLSHAEGESHDPENRLLWRMNRRRLDWESLRDSLLTVSGQIDLTMGGPSVPLLSEPFSGRRTIYGFVDRQNLPGLLRTFDFVAPDSSAPQRLQTSVPQQALYLLNSPFMRQQTTATATRVLAMKDGNSQPTFEQLIEALYQTVFSRHATPDEVELGREYLSETSLGNGSPSTTVSATDPSATFDPWQEYVQALLLSNEFCFID